MGRLPEAETEVRELARLYGSGSRVYVGEAATESMLKSQARWTDVFHVATH